ncbi:MAG: group II intron reverse transcriptase/maturase [Actinobacteria bacterium]|nr:group II intron reverse transcriptase/maturase [Actinomycetota bacterium]MCA1706425.1 group II intron reverse transcriptase/maturase [Actinomycetota bacterium]
MNERGKSDRPVVPEKPANNAASAVAEAVEERGLPEGNAAREPRPGHRAGYGVSSDLDRVRQLAREDKQVRFTALLHHLTVDRLRESYRALRPAAAPGVDGVTWRDYGVDLEANLRDLHARVHRGAYRARPTRRAYIPKPDGRQRPLGVAALEDKILQRAVVEVLNAIYEQDFLGFSYGFRPGRSPHDALDALVVGIERRRVNFVLDADIRDFFTSLDWGWLERFLEHRIADRRVLRLIQKWLRAGVIEDGEWSKTDEGTAQGASASPLLANVYLHYVFDLWADQWRRRHARGDVILVRFADDYVAGFEHREDAERFLADLRERLAKFNLELAAEKTRLIEFGRFAARDRVRRGDRKPETFEFLGFTHVCAKDRHGRFKLRRITSKKKMRAKLRSLKVEMMRRRDYPIPVQGRWLASVLRGHYGYYAVPDNSEALHGFRRRVVRHWRRALSRRSQKGRVTWQQIHTLADRWLPQPRIRHPWPNQRFDAKTRRRSPVR